jgi:hypothetical protein
VSGCSDEQGDPCPQLVSVSTILPWLDLGIDGRIILKWILKEWYERVDRIQLTQEWICEHNNEPLASIKAGIT